MEGPNVWQAESDITRHVLIEGGVRTCASPDSVNIMDSVRLPTAGIICCGKCLRLRCAAPAMGYVLVAMHFIRLDRIEKHFRRDSS